MLFRPRLHQGTRNSTCSGLISTLTSRRRSRELGTELMLLTMYLPVCYVCIHSCPLYARGVICRSSFIYVAMFYYYSALFFLSNYINHYTAITASERVSHQLRLHTTLIHIVLRAGYSTETIKERPHSC